MSDAERTDDDLYDTVIGCRGGNWISGWATQAMVWQRKSLCGRNPQLSGRHLAACRWVTTLPPILI
ncbi:alpha/beta hydrolase [Shigella flexneri]